MRDIKTREKSTGTVRTIDRASMLSYRMKQASVKAKNQAAGFRTEDERNEVAYAEEDILSLTGSGAVLSRDAAVKSFKEARHIKGAIGSRAKSEKESAPKSNYDTLESYAIVGDSEKEYGKYIKNDKLPTKTVKVSYPISNDNYGKTPINTTNVPGKHIKSEIKSTNEVIKQAENGEKLLKKQYRIKLARQTAKYRSERSGKKIIASLKRTIADEKLMTAVLSVAGCIAMISIIVCTFFGSAFYILGDENSEYIPEGFEGIGDAGIVEVAASQIGNVGGEPYWSWYGFNDRVEWCACFVSWCAHKCGYIEAGIIPKFAGVGIGINWFQDRHQWQKRGYQPKPGDIIFFDWDGDGYGNHVGIVESSDETYVYTIEGNTSDRCKRRTYFLHSTVIMGYGIPRYKSIEIEDGDLRNHPLS